MSNIYQTKRCSQCKELKTLEEFNGRQTSPDGKRSACKNCEKQQRQTWQITTPQRRTLNMHPELHGSKKCSQCKQVKDYSEFDKNAQISDGYNSSCKACRKPQRAAYYQQNAERLRNYDAVRDSRARRLRKYALTKEAYDTMLAQQNGVCAICKKPEIIQVDGITHSLGVDHDHSTGLVRGLLCRRCNNGLGYFKDDPVLLANAISYLSEYRIEQIS